MGSLVTTTVDYYGRVPKNRIVTGPLYVIVRNSTGKDDFFDACFTDWAVAPGAGGVPDELQESQPFQEVGDAPTDPSGSGVSDLRTGRGKSIGDYDVTMFHVTSAGAMGASIPVTDDAEPPGSGGGTATEGHYWLKSELSGFGNSDENTWADSWIHPECQSFVRYTLLSRHNNSYGHATAYWDYSGSGMERTRFFYDADPTSGNQVSLAQPSSNATDEANDVLAADKMVNTGKFSAGAGGNNSFYQDNLSTVSKNTWFSPVYDIEIFGFHPFDATQNSQSYGGTTLYSAPTHNVTSYDLVVRFKLFSYQRASTVFVDFEDRVNIFYQPFGETANIRFDTSAHTS